MTCLHKYYSQEELIEFLADSAYADHTFVTLGIRDEEFNKLLMVKEQAGVRFVDAANGYTKFFVDRVKRCARPFDLTIMAGNVATRHGTGAADLGAADIVKSASARAACVPRAPRRACDRSCRDRRGADAAHGCRARRADGGAGRRGRAKAFAAGRGLRHAGRTAGRA
jgi:GMP reductase